ncbi:MAG: methyltransferase, partial [Cyanobium sp.]
RADLGTRPRFGGRPGGGMARALDGYGDGPMVNAVEAIRTRLSQWGFSWGGLRDNRRGEWWLIAQLALIAAHLLPPTPAPMARGVAWPLALRLLGWGTFALGLVLAALAVGALGASLTPLPEPMPEAPLVTTGAYGRCRHPLYQALLVCSLGVVVALGSLLHLALLLALGGGCSAARPIERNNAYSSSIRITAPIGPPPRRSSPTCQDWTGIDPRPHPHRQRRWSASSSRGTASPRPCTVKASRSTALLVG